MQGDREDRLRTRQQAERQKKRAAAQQEADELAEQHAFRPEFSLLHKPCPHSLNAC